MFNYSQYALFQVSRLGGSCTDGFCNITLVEHSQEYELCKRASGFPLWGRGLNKMLKLFVALQNRFAELRDREEGQAYVEYGVLLAIVAIGVIATMILFKKDIIAAFDGIRGEVQNL